MMPSNRKFAYNFSLIFIVISLISFYFEKINLFYLFIFLSAFFLIGGKLKPNMFEYFNHLWSKIAIILHYIISPIIIFLIFFLIITPFGLIGRFFSKDLKKISGIKIENSSNFLDYENKTNYDNQF